MMEQAYGTAVFRRGGEKRPEWAKTGCGAAPVCDRRTKAFAATGKPALLRDGISNLTTWLSQRHGDREKRRFVYG